MRRNRSTTITLGDYEPSALHMVVSTVGMALGAYHGYKRNSSIGWALWWGFAGAVVPIVTVPIAIAQGFGQPAQGTAGYLR